MEIYIQEYKLQIKMAIAIGLLLGLSLPSRPWKVLLASAIGSGMAAIIVSPFWGELIKTDHVLHILVYYIPGACILCIFYFGPVGAVAAGIGIGVRFVFRKAFHRRVKIS